MQARTDRAKALSRTATTSSLALLNAAVACTDRAYVFDNSCDDARVLVAEVTEGNELEMKTDLMPYWFKTALWDKFGGDAVA